MCIDPWRNLRVFIFALYSLRIMKRSFGFDLKGEKL